MQRTLHLVFTSRQLLLAATAKPVTPLVELVILIMFFNTLKLGKVLGWLRAGGGHAGVAWLVAQWQGGLIAWRGVVFAGGARCLTSSWRS